MVSNKSILSNELINYKLWTQNMSYQRDLILSKSHFLNLYTHKKVEYTITTIVSKKWLKKGDTFD